MKTKLTSSLFKGLVVSSVLTGYMSSCTGNVEPPKPYGAIPSEKQIEWQQLEYYMFIHFGPNTFTNVEWGDGKEDPKVFNPTDVDCRQWASIAKDAGMKGIIITAKHHDGFCLWPSAYSTHTVRESLWKDGKGDILRELSDACKEYGLKFGVYLSPWDQNHPSYGTPEYNQIFVNTLTEVLSNYGEVYEQWFDGANGDAHKGKKQEYDWDLFHKTVYSLQPQALIFSDVGPDCRWIGNERGVAGETNWSRLNVEGFEPGLGAPPTDTLNVGNIFGAKWVPGETNTSIRPGWFYSPETDDKVKSLDHLVDIYYTSIGRNTNFLLNVPPDRRRKIHPNDSARLMELRRAVDKSFATNLVEGAVLRALNTRGGLPEYGIENLRDGKFDSYWAADDDVRETSIEIEWQSPQSFNRFLVQEYIPLGQRVASFTVEKWNDSAAGWDLIVEGTTIGYKRILRFPVVTAQKIRLNITGTLASPILNGIGVYKAPESFGTGNSNMLDIASLGISPKELYVVTHHPDHAGVFTDGDLKTSTKIDDMQSIVIDLKTPLSLKGFVYVPKDDNTISNITRYNFYVSMDGKNWTPVQKNAVFNNIKNNPIPQTPLFNKPVKAQFIKLEPLETTTGERVYHIAELNVIKE